MELELRYRVCWVWKNWRRFLRTGSDILSGFGDLSGGNERAGVGFLGELVVGGGGVVVSDGRGGARRSASGSEWSP